MGRCKGNVKLSDHTATIGPHAEISRTFRKAVVINGAVVGNVTASRSSNQAPAP